MERVFKLGQRCSVSRTNRRGLRKVRRDMIALSKAQVFCYEVCTGHHGLTLLNDIVSRKELYHFEQFCMLKHLRRNNNIAQKKEGSGGQTKVVGQSDSIAFPRTRSE